MLWRILMLLCLCVGMFNVAKAAPLEPPVIAQVYGSVFVKHEGKYQRATLGMALSMGDEVRTLARSKVYIDFPDNSRLKLGMQAHVVLQDWTTSSANIFVSSLSIVKGAFRYTASVLRGWSSRSTKVYTKTAVIGVRGTDFWGRVQADNTFFLLLEGSVDLTPRNGKEERYEQVGFAVNIQGNISPPKGLPNAEIAVLAAETEIKN